MAQLQRGPIANPLDNPEVVLNLWVYADDDGTVFRVAGRAYVLCGTEKEKLAQLRCLAASDFLAAKWQKVPDNFTLQHTNGQSLKGVANLSDLRDPVAHSAVFKLVIKEAEQDLPQQLRSIRAEYESFVMKIPKEPLYVTTVVIEREDGALVPMIS